MSDFELLRAYAEQGAEDAFTDLVNRHINLVYAAALRQVRDPDTAVEIAQSVFIILARKAKTIRQGAVLAGWPLRTTRYTAANVRRHEQHRHQTEQEAMDHLYPTDTEAAWKQIAPRLDEALIALREGDRDAVALRFFEEKSYKEIGAALSLSEDSARKKVTRAVVRLRTMLSKRGCTLPLAVVTAAVSANASKAAPAQLATVVAATALLKGPVAAGALPMLVQSTLRTLNLLRWRSVGTGATAVAVVVCAGLLLAKQYANHGTQEPNGAPVVATTPVSQPAPGPAASESISSANQLAGQPGVGPLLFRVLDAENHGALAKDQARAKVDYRFPGLPDQYIRNRC